MAMTSFPWNFENLWAPVDNAMMPGSAASGAAAFNMTPVNAMNPMRRSYPEWVNPVALNPARPAAPVAPALPPAKPPELAAPAPPSLVDGLPFASPLPQRSGLLGVLGNMFGGHANEVNPLIALGAGIAGGGRNWNEAVGRGLQMALAGHGENLKQRQADQSKNLTYQALLARGVPETEARAAMASPEILRALTNQYFAPKSRSFGTIGRDERGWPKYGWVGQPGEVTPDGSPK